MHFNINNIVSVHNGGTETMLLILKCMFFLDKGLWPKYSLISRTDKVELIATEFFQQSWDCLGYLEQHTKSCKSYLVGKYIFFRLKNDHLYA